MTLGGLPTDLRSNLMEKRYQSVSWAIFSFLFGFGVASIGPEILAVIPDKPVASCIAGQVTRSVCKPVVSQLTSYLLESNVLNEAQHAYVPGRSTETTLASVVACISDEIDSKNVVSLASVDLSSAFDCVSHSILLQKIVWCGIDPTWFKDYLTEQAPRS